MHLVPQALNDLSDSELQSVADTPGHGPTTLPMTKAGSSKMPATRNLHGKSTQVCADANKAISLARNRQKQQTDQRMRDNSSSYVSGKQASVSTRNVNLKLPSGATTKLMPKYLGPIYSPNVIYDISIVFERVGPLAYRLTLAGTVLSACCNVFHVSRLHPYRSLTIWQMVQYSGL